jgi:serine O-acetyltransferase
VNPPTNKSALHQMTPDADLQADLERYPARPFLREQSIWAVWVYRFGRRVLKRKPGVLRSLQLYFYWGMFRIVETTTGISLPLNAQIGPGLRIYHFGNIFIHSDVIIGRNCTLRHGVTIGNRSKNGGVPTVGDNVEFGVGSVAIGPIHIASGAKIGPLSLVTSDVPEKARVIGNPGQILRLKV